MATKGSLFAHNLRAKKKTQPELAQTLPLPVHDKVGVESLRIEAVFTGFSIDVTHSDSIRVLCLNGGFGQGMLSRAFPACVTNSREQVRKRKRNTATSANMTNMVPNSSIQENENEPLCLFLEEAFFLMHTLNILNLKDLFDKHIDTLEAFERFRKIKTNFLACYCAYLYLKSKNWVVKSGIKFGGDFVIYVKGPQFYHASYIVLVQEMHEGKLIDSHTVEGLDFQGFNRIAETTAKDVLFLEVHYPATLDLSDNAACLESLNDVRVAELFTKHHNYLAARNQI
ncbi:tRNA-splicing endonuclease subunit Sen2 [Anopheles funestus]|uniref:tRNA-splicing endonuclease subunit Sen2 n=1 Tax=Anopheles funestus TaxID=62324 RepID=UPI0020C5BA35|nr:tRNA-splicing endonuclease subunit Sen2 [Anopheles funestus]XP_049282803.1 tRNA-splicing endonuclease subunit Sen2 [Anopheles funestus]